MRSFGKRLLSGIFMVFGTTVGAGMLGIPAVTAGVGFGSALGVTFLVWVFMAITGLLLLEVSLKMGAETNMISLSARFLGRYGKWASGLLFLFLYYCLLVAYFSGGGPLLGQLLSWGGCDLGSMAYIGLFALIFGGVVFLGVGCIDKVNILLTGAMLLCYLFLFVLGAGSVSMDNLSAREGNVFVWTAVPVLFSAFGFHNVVPPLVGLLKRDKKALRASVILGTLLAFVVYALWQWIILGSVPLEKLKEVALQGLPMTYALQAVSGNGSVFVFGQLFAFFALTTSFLGVGFSFVDFIQDGFREHGKVRSRFFCAMLTLVPPFLCVLWVPSLFEKALGMAGGFGESALNGIIPVLLFIKASRSLQVSKKAGLGFLLAMSLGVAVIEMGILSR